MESRIKELLIQHNIAPTLLEQDSQLQTDAEQLPTPEQDVSTNGVGSHFQKGKAVRSTPQLYLRLVENGPQRLDAMEWLWR